MDLCWQSSVSAFKYVILLYLFNIKIHRHREIIIQYYEMIRCLFPGRKVMTNLDNILKSRDITLPTKVYLVKAMVFPVVMYGCESWTIKKLSTEELIL